MPAGNADSERGDATRVQIENVASADEDGLHAVSDLHMELLDFGPLAGLGPRFIREIGYRLHIDDDLLQVALCRVDGEPAGFVSYTARSISFHRQSLGAHWPRVCWILFLSLAADPRRLAKLVRALRVVVSRRKEQRRGSDPMGEVVSIAVRQKFLSNKIVDAQGRRLSVALIEYARERLREQGVDEMRMLVDADNKLALFMYHGLGARMESYEQAGEPMVEVWFDLQAGGRDAAPTGS